MKKRGYRAGEKGCTFLPPFSLLTKTILRRAPTIPATSRLCLVLTINCYFRKQTNQQMIKRSFLVETVSRPKTRDESNGSTVVKKAPRIIFLLVRHGICSLTLSYSNSYFSLNFQGGWSGPVTLVAHFKHMPPEGTSITSFIKIGQKLWKLAYHMG